VTIAQNGFDFETISWTGHDYHRQTHYTQTVNVRCYRSKRSASLIAYRTVRTCRTAK